ncbi:MAG: hypothetical protein CM15mP102_00220 [Flavobacteriales bacterium]|nr:MAG: hypothetical protein CM15mP102_00220 [Flavobacteriales bacterium]
MELQKMVLIRGCLISEKELSNVHAAGYYSSIPAGVQTVMASFSSWNGRKLHGDKELLTDVLKEKWVLMDLL